ncbi:hypothetical protein AVEN_36210-1 [Araneus ventricosus]|uniref:Uncharacterized protein n=1 Tax=Araneus ventricosus TaxID=182803 RepID=A0A4Y2KI38_ARAVE|nr:hypothetical protein AVEN_36210-1 [Araneus ventricosus]
MHSISNAYVRRRDSLRGDQQWHDVSLNEAAQFQFSETVGCMLSAMICISGGCASGAASSFTLEDFVHRYSEQTGPSICTCRH